MAELLSVSEYAAAMGKDGGNIRKLIAAGRIPAVKVGNQWCIEAGTPYPADNRVKNGKYRDWRKPKTEPEKEPEE